MKLITSARLNSMQDIVKRQAGTIRDFIKEINRLERENRMQAERIAGLEAVLYAAGVLDKDAVLASDGDKSWYADQVLDLHEMAPAESARPFEWELGGKDIFRWTAAGGGGGAK